MFGMKYIGTYTILFRSIMFHNKLSGQEKRLCRYSQSYSLHTNILYSRDVKLVFSFENDRLQVSSGDIEYRVYNV